MSIEVEPELPHSEVANRIRMMNAKEYEGLLADIKLNGQMVPATIWQWKVVDGRNRQRACKELGIKLKCEVLPDSTTKEQLTAIMISSQKRRKDNVTDRAVLALKTWLEGDATSQAQAAKLCGVSRAVVTLLKYIYDHYPAKYEALANGDTLEEYNPLLGKIVRTNKLKPLHTALKAQEAKLAVIVQPYVDYSSVIPLFSEEAKDTYIEWVKNYTDLYSTPPSIVTNLLIDKLRLEFVGAEKMAYDEWVVPKNG